jgi:hypothetical protein
MKEAVSLRLHDQALISTPLSFRLTPWPFLVCFLFGRSVSLLVKGAYMHGILSSYTMSFIFLTSALNNVG